MRAQEAERKHQWYLKNKEKKAAAQRAYREAQRRKRMGDTLTDNEE